MTARRDDDPLAGAIIVVHDLSRPGGVSRDVSGTPEAASPATPSSSPASSASRWVGAARYGLTAVSFTLFGAFGVMTWLGRAPVTPTFGTLVAPPKVEIRVHVDGAVLQPGVYRLAQGDRVEEAIKAAGGLAPHADQSKLNLSQRVRDEQRLDVPALPLSLAALAAPATGSSEPQAQPDPSDPPGAASPRQPAPTTSASSQVTTAPRPTSTPRPQAKARPTGTPRPQPTARATAFARGRVNVNTATQAQLEQLPGLGATSAQRILAFRAANGPLRSLDDVRKAGVQEQFVRQAADYLAFE